MRLEASALACVRGGREVFAGIGFAVGAGQALQITGRNGAGKSTLLRLVAGLVRIAAGTLRLDGGAPEASIGEQAHYLGHQDALKPALTVAENLRFWTDYLRSTPPPLRGRSPSEARREGGQSPDPDTPLPNPPPQGGRERAACGATSCTNISLDKVGLAALADLPAGYLSAGQRRRLSLARLVAVPRPIWLLDEPTAALDREAQAMLHRLMRAHLDGGGLILAATHDALDLPGASELRLGAVA